MGVWGSSTLREGAPGTHYMKVWVGPRAGLGTLENRYLKNAGHRSAIPRTSSLWPGHYIYYAIPVHMYLCVSCGSNNNPRLFP
jgi:hypothetical protein